MGLLPDLKTFIASIIITILIFYIIFLRFHISVLEESNALKDDMYMYREPTIIIIDDTIDGPIPDVFYSKT